ncbi:UDP-N-acetylmuramate--L-alanine ligase [bacterium]|nr:UDP-N-acetylmuramate--L-alanine ligase [bacterium]
MFKKIKHIHFVGIGGSGMNGIAEILINMGYRVSGSDLKETEVTQRLAKMGGNIFIGHRRENINDVHVVVSSTAIDRNNIEIQEAKTKNIPVIRRAEMLAELMRLKYAVAIAGTHGKTTTTSMTAWVLAQGGFDPTVVVGGRFNNIGGGAKLGKGDYLVAEADESDGSFLKLTPTIAVITNIDNDHLDYYGNMENIQKAFVQFINKVPFYGCAILCNDNKNLRDIYEQIDRKYFTYGVETPADFFAGNIKFGEVGCEFDVEQKGEKLGRVKIGVLGMHNVSNALAGIVCGLELGIDFSCIKEALGDFKGVKRRMEIVGEENGFLVIDDYAHHPTAIQFTLETIKKIWPHRRLVVVFQPHRYTRTRDLYQKFGECFKDADIVKILDIYPAGEKPIPGITSQLILKNIKKHGKDIQYFPLNDAFQVNLTNLLRPRDIVITLGAGDVWKTGRCLLEQFKKIKL